MKKDIHPANYREVVFKDMSNDETFITRSTVATRETIEIDGVTATAFATKNKTLPKSQQPMRKA